MAEGKAGVGSLLSVLYTKNTILYLLMFTYSKDFSGVIGYGCFEPNVFLEEILGNVEHFFL